MRLSSILWPTARLDCRWLRREKAKLLTGRRVALLFCMSWSTRDGDFVLLAAKSLGATTTLVSDKSSSIEKGESLKDTGLMLRALGGGVHYSSASGFRASPFSAGAVDGVAGAGMQG